MSVFSKLQVVYLDGAGNVRVKSIGLTAEQERAVNDYLLDNYMTKEAYNKSVRKQSKYYTGEWVKAVLGEEPTDEAARTLWLEQCKRAKLC